MFLICCSSPHTHLPMQFCHRFPKSSESLGNLGLISSLRMSPLHKISYLDDLFHYKLGVIIIRYVCCCLNIVRISVVDIVYLTKNLSYTEAPKKESMLIWVYYKAWTKMTWHPAKSPDPVLQTTSFCSAGSNQSA